MFNNIKHWAMPNGQDHWLCWFDDDCMGQLGTNVAYAGEFTDGVLDAVDGPNFYGDGDE